MKKKILHIFLIYSIIAVILGGCTSAGPSTSGYSSPNPSSNNIDSISGKSSKPSTNNSSTSSNNTSENKEKVTCSMCNGTGSVKYYYGSSALEAALDGYNDYEYGPCTSCDGKGYTYIKVTETSGKKSSSSGVVCPSCGKKVSSLKSKKDAAGVSRKWCSSCWSDYDKIMGN